MSAIENWNGDDGDDEVSAASAPLASGSVHGPLPDGASSPPPLTPLVLYAPPK